LVTGGAGFIGSHLVERLVEDGWRVRVLDNFSTGARANLGSALRAVELLEGDVRDPRLCREACRGVDSVFHLAAIASVPGSIADPLLCHEVNATGTLALLAAAREAGARRFVFSSSASVYGNAETVPTGEDQPLRPESPYATSKACGEMYARNFWDLFGLETVCLRYFNVFGPRQRARTGYAAAIPKFVEAAVVGARPTVYGDGLQTRDFVFVGNVVEANVRAATREEAPGQTVNIGCGEEISLLDLLAHLERLTGRPLPPELAPARPGEIRHSVADISRARRVLGYEPTLSFAEGLRLTLAAAAVSRQAPVRAAA
jgi:nucleoside-diphosphate-sugar epimerase